MSLKKCGNCSEEKNCSEYRLVKEKRTKNATEYLCSMCKDCERKKALENYRKNRDRDILNNKKYKEQNKEKINETRRKYNRELMKNPLEKIKRNMKSLISCKIRNYKSKHTAEYLGKDIKTIMSWLEYNMEEKMNWENYGDYWEIDHSIPISLFDITNEEEMITCFCWMNLMPMIKTENSKKSNKILVDNIEHQKNRLKSYSEQFPQLQKEIEDYIKKYDSKYKSL